MGQSANRHSDNVAQPAELAMEEMDSMDGIPSLDRISV